MNTLDHYTESKAKGIRTYKARGAKKNTPDVDPIVTEIIRHSLNSAANQMKSALVRTSFSPVIYEVLDFASALYDVDIRLLAQAPSLPLFMGTLNFCIEAALKEIGGPENLDPGDVILYNWPYGTGSHAQDAALIQGAYNDVGEIIGYAAIKAHWLDIGANAPYCTDTTDVYQEGTFFPGVKLFKKGKIADDIYRMILANSRLPKATKGDIMAQATGINVGVRELERLVKRYGKKTYSAAIEKIFDQGEAVVREYFEKLPDGTYTGHGLMDNNGVDKETLPFEITLTIKGSDISVDFSQCPDVQSGPVNCPVPSTISASRVAIAVLAGQNEAPNEGFFRPIEVVTRANSLFDPDPPAPCFLYGWPAVQAIEALYHAVSEVNANAVPACSGGDVCSLIWWGTRTETGEAWGDGSPFPCGHGGHFHGDGCTMMHIAESATRFTALEVMESKYPWMIEGCELIPDSCGAGRNRGGLGYSLVFRMLEDAFVTSVIERTISEPWGNAGGFNGTANSAMITFPDGETKQVAKITSQNMPKGSTFTLNTGGGGGFGDPKNRDIEKVKFDLREGYITQNHIRKYYPQAV